MQLAVPPYPDREIWSAPTPSTPRGRSLFAASVALVGASVIAVNPVTLPLPDAREQAVQLAALADPLAEWTNVFEGAREHLEWRGIHFEQFTLPVIEGLLTNPILFEEALGLLTNPVAGLTTFVGNLPNYANTISEGLQESAAGLQQSLADLPATFEQISTALGEGDFMGAFSAINSWVIFSLGYTIAWPLADAIGLPATIAKDLGATTIGNVIGELVSQESLIGYAYSTMSPPIVAAWVVSEAFGELGTALADGDFETALGSLINLPAKVTNAFLNGQYVEYDGVGQVVPGLLSEDGPIGILFRDIPEKFRVAWEKSQEELGLTSTAEAATVPSELAQVVSTDLTPADAAVAVKVKSTAAQSGGAADPSAPTPVSDATAAEVDDEESQQESTAEDSSTADGTGTDTDTDTETVVDEGEESDETDSTATDSTEAQTGAKAGAKESVRTGIADRLKRGVRGAGGSGKTADSGAADSGTSTGSDRSTSSSRSERGTAGSAKSGSASSGSASSGSAKSGSSATSSSAGSAKSDSSSGSAKSDSGSGGKSGGKSGSTSSSDD